jgi:hypothetical protein
LSAVTDAVLQVHRGVSLPLLVFLAAGAAWGIVEFAVGGRLSVPYDRLLWVAQALLGLQVASGICALLVGRAPDGPAHLLAGTAAALLPLLTWAAARRRRRVSLAMGLACLAALAAGAGAHATGG